MTSDELFGDVMIELIQANARLEVLLDAVADLASDRANVDSRREALRLAAELRAEELAAKYKQRLAARKDDGS